MIFIMPWCNFIQHFKTKNVIQQGIAIELKKQLVLEKLLILINF